MFILAQVFGFISLVVVVISLQAKQKQRLLRLQILSNLFLFAQYACLGTISGCLMCLLGLGRNFLYGRFKKVPRTLVAAIVLLIIILAIFSYDGPLSLLPCLATVVYTIGLSSRKMLFVRLADIAACLFYLVYNINVGAYFAIITTLVELSSSAIGIVRLDLKKRGVKQPRFNKPKTKQLASKGHKK